MTHTQRLYCALVGLSLLAWASPAAAQLGAPVTGQFSSAGPAGVLVLWEGTEEDPGHEAEAAALGGFTLLLSGPGASGSRAMPGGESQEPGGWNRVVLRVTDLPARIDALKKAGVTFRNQMETGPGGRQIQIQDPDGNPIELFEPGGR